MSNDKVVSLHTPAEDVLGELLKNGAKQLLAQAVQAELNELLDRHKDLSIDDGRQAVVKNGFLPERTIQTGLGDIPVKVPKVRDRSGQGIKFNSHLVPPYLKRAKSVEELLPWLYLKGVSTGDFQESLQSLLGADASGLSAGTISRLKRQWEEDYDQLRKRDLSNRRYVYIWADGVYCNVRQDDKLCLLVIMGSDSTGRKEIVGLLDWMATENLRRAGKNY